MSISTRAGIAAAAMLLSGCTGSLVVTDDKGAAMEGIPVVQYENWVEDGLYTRLAKGGDCEPAPYHKAVSLPTGPKYYVRAEGSTFAKTAFTVKLNGDGALTELTFNTDSNIPDTLNATANLLKALPSIGVTGAKVQPPDAKPSCDTGETVKTITPLTDWIKAH